MDSGTRDVMTAAKREHSGPATRVVERRKAQRRSPPPEISESGSYRVDDRRLCHGRRWEDWRRS